MAHVTTPCCVVLVLIGCITAQISYPKKLEIGRNNRNKIIKCTVESSISLSSTPLHVYRQRQGEAIQRIMHFSAGTTSAMKDQGTPSRLTGRIQGQTVTLTLSSLQPEDTATYYCAVWKGDTVLNREREAVHKPRAASQIRYCALLTNAVYQIISEFPMFVY